ncbi:MAG: hypothetical protein ABH856_01265, partial [Patescibacteria group bacterium]
MENNFKEKRLIFFAKGPEDTDEGAETAEESDAKANTAKAALEEALKKEIREKLGDGTSYKEIAQALLEKQLLGLDGNTNPEKIGKFAEKHGLTLKRRDMPTLLTAVFNTFGISVRKIGEWGGEKSIERNREQVDPMIQEFDKVYSAIFTKDKDYPKYRKILIENRFKQESLTMTPEDLTAYNKWLT